MRILTRDEFLRILDMSEGQFDQLQHTGHVALAFAAPLPAVAGRYLPLDLVAMAISQGLTPTMGRDFATAIVLGYFNQWASAVGHAEADRSEDYFVSIGGMGWDRARKRPKLLLITNGTLISTAHDFRSPEVARIGRLVGGININISDIIRRIRERAVELGIALDEPFYYAPGDFQFDRIIKRVQEERDGRIRRLRADKKKSAAMRKHMRRSDIKAVHDIKYEGLEA